MIDPLVKMKFITDGAVRVHAREMSVKRTSKIDCCWDLAEPFSIEPFLLYKKVYPTFSSN